MPPPQFINHLTAGVVRKDPLGPVTLNTLNRNVEVIDSLFLREHLNDGQHNALEVPWILGHINNSTTGYMFDTAFGGGSFTRPSTGRVTLNAAAGVIGEAPDFNGDPINAASVIANVSDSAIATYPHVIEAELISSTSIELRTRYMTSTLGSPGNSWSSVAVAVDVAVHAAKQAADASLLLVPTLKQRGQYLRDTALEWNALVRNQGALRKALSLEHQSDGTHLVDRIAKASGWFKPAAGPSFTTLIGHGVSAVSRVSAGIVEVTIATTLEASLNYAATFCTAQPASADELVFVNGRCTASNKFRYYIYVYSIAENKWTRDDRPFSAVMYGRPA